MTKYNTKLGEARITKLGFNIVCSVFNNYKMSFYAVCIKEKNS